MSAVPVAYLRQANGNWVAVVPSPAGTTLKAGAGGSITDAAGNVWTLPSTGISSVNGVPDLSTWGVTELAYDEGQVWQFNGTDWYSKTVPLWATGTTASPLLSAALAWAAPMTNTNGTPTGLLTYTISYGTTPALTNKVSVATAGYTFSNLAAGTWHFQVVAVNSFGVSSAPSNIVSKTIP